MFIQSSPLPDFQAGADCEKLEVQREKRVWCVHDSFSGQIPALHDHVVTDVSGAVAYDGQALFEPGRVYFVRDVIREFLLVAEHRFSGPAVLGEVFEFFFGRFHIFVRGSV